MSDQLTSMQHTSRHFRKGGPGVPTEEESSEHAGGKLPVAALRRLRQGDSELKVSLRYTANLSA